MLLDHRIVSFEIKAATEDQAPGTFSGYGSVFNTVDSYNDTIAKGAFRQSLKEWKATKKLPKMLLQHGGGWFGSPSDNLPIGKWDEMREDDTGLYVEGRLFEVDTDRLKETSAALRSGELDGLSIGFLTRKSKMNEDTGIRTLTEVKLFEVSPVLFPANPPARITSVKGEDEEYPTDRAFERFLRETGFTKHQAQIIIAEGFEYFLRDAGFTEADARLISSQGYRQMRRDAMSSDQACEALLALFKQRAAVFTGQGDQTHGRHIHGSQSSD